MIVRVFLVVSLFSFALSLPAQEIIVDREAIGRYLTRTEFRSMQKGVFTLENGNHWRLHQTGLFRKSRVIIEFYPNAHIDKISKFNRSSKIAVCGVGLAVISPQAIEMPVLIDQLNQIQFSNSSQLTLGDDLERLETGNVIFLSYLAYQVCDLVDLILINRYINGKSKYNNRTKEVNP